MTKPSQASFFSPCTTAAPPAPSSTSALVESVHSAEESTKSTTDVADHSVSRNSTGDTSPKLITSMVIPPDITQANETTMDSTSTPVTDLPAPINSGPAARSASNSASDPLAPVRSDPMVVSAATTTVVAPVNSDAAASSTPTSVANLLALVNLDRSTLVVNSPAPVDMERIETHPQFTSALSYLGELSAREVAGDQSVEVPISSTSTGSTDVIMADDMNLPVYLTGMIGYLRSVAPDRAWQDLVTNFVAFEKAGHAGIGVSAVQFIFEYVLTNFHNNQNLLTKSRPREISDWIRSKKKDIVPFINPSAYGVRLLEWWGAMQPPWRLFRGVEGPLDLVRETLESETWQGLNKGGTAGLYTVVMGLSWWIKAQRNKSDPIAWAAVDDISWVIKQLSNVPSSSTLQKRSRDPQDDGEDDNDQSENKRRYVLSYSSTLLVANVFTSRL